MLNFLQGKKTYIVSGAMILYAVLGLILGNLEQDQFMQLILNALGLGALRSGINKV